MARHHGVAGQSLLVRLAVLAAIVIGFPTLVYAGINLIAPAFSPLATLAALGIAVSLLRDRTISRKLVALGRGAIGEATVAAALARLPTGWRVFHDVALDGENVDHVAVSNRGVFSVEVKNHSGHIVVNGGVIYRNGRADRRILPQVRRQREKLVRRLGTDVSSVLVFVGIDIGDHRIGDILVTSTHRLPEHLMAHRERRLSLEEGRRVFASLEPLTQMHVPNRPG